ncbi:hypothetical protein GN958_ATG06760 [Phytophthora infestans]|uniref:Uncharacterized protein n=1 Tax=Phytophthora infestans TaxID=4787 RepID=A0A8S9V0Y5_PHYIN|nr:hypothetical protein GN958_ATG06760 [Phytophthora infestans]
MEDDKTNARKWRARLHDLTRTIYKSRRSLVETIEVNVRAAKAKPKQAANPWMERIAQRAPMQEEDDEMNGRAAPSTFRFLTSSYGPKEIDELRRICEMRYVFPSRLRPPSKLEWKVVKGILEGTILCLAKLLDFLKRVCTNVALRVVQNTIRVQVEGDLMLMLSPEFKIYP